MPSGPSAPGICSRCGGPNPPASSFCQFCGVPLSGPMPFEPPPPPPVLPDNYRLVASNRDEHEGPGLALLVIGILLIVVSLILFGVAAAIHQGVQSFNNACAQNPLCTPQSDPSGAIAGAGVGVILLGIILLVVGVRVYWRD